MKLRKLNEDQMAKLNAESHALEDQVSELIKGLSVDSKCLDQDTWNPWIQVDGYAMPFLELTCVDVLLEQERQQSYQALFESYQSDMESLESKYADVVSNPTSGWSKSSHTAFVKLQLEFASQCQNRLKLMYDRFKLTVKDKTVSKSAFNQHDVWVSQSESYKNQRYSTNEWYKSHIKGFIERTKALYQVYELS